MIAIVLFAIVSGTHARAQEGDRYLVGQERRLEILVHVMGEVRNPGEFRVPDTTNILELISRAGGPTELAKFSAVRLTHVEGKAEPRVQVLNLDAFLTASAATASTSSLPPLMPGDVVVVPRNAMSKWRSVATILRDISVVATAYFLYVRTFHN